MNESHEKNFETEDFIFVNEIDKEFYSILQSSNFSSFTYSPLIFLEYFDNFEEMNPSQKFLTKMFINLFLDPSILRNITDNVGVNKDVTNIMINIQRVSISREEFGLSQKLNDEGWTLCFKAKTIDEIEFFEEQKIPYIIQVPVYFEKAENVELAEIPSIVTRVQSNVKGENVPFDYVSPHKSGIRNSTHYYYEPIALLEAKQQLEKSMPSPHQVDDYVLELDFFFRYMRECITNERVFEHCVGGDVNFFAVLREIVEFKNNEFVPLLNEYFPKFQQLFEDNHMCRNEFSDLQELKKFILPIINDGEVTGFSPFKWIKELYVRWKNRNLVTLRDEEELRMKDVFDLAVMYTDKTRGSLLHASCMFKKFYVSLDQCDEWRFYARHFFVTHDGYNCRNIYSLIYRDCEKLFTNFIFDFPKLKCFTYIVSSASSKTDLTKILSKSPNLEHCEIEIVLRSSFGHRLLRLLEEHCLNLKTLVFNVHFDTLFLEENICLFHFSFPNLKFLAIRNFDLLQMFDIPKIEHISCFRVSHPFLPVQDHVLSLNKFSQLKTLQLFDIVPFKFTDIPQSLKLIMISDEKCSKMQFLHLINQLFVDLKFVGHILLCNKNYKLHRCVIGHFFMNEDCESWKKHFSDCLHHLPQGPFEKEICLFDEQYCDELLPNNFSVETFLLPKITGFHS
eukprot:TRINITY_DN3294_c0_g1_i1.p1 TRINITY_DN3294_c0_g1~~TRINITY_DN3294_c0_g1_i1.p1  ORF type:complete len:677 (+),score=168.00 TRINITY_DN3294_c0_g1_i1:68-2098(+)